MNKTQKYHTLSQQITSICEGEKDLIANLANITSILHYELGHWWTGFYFVKEEQLVLGPFQGPIACTRISFGKGVCGKAWEMKETVVVENVHEFPGHIACSSESNSEIVIPILKEEQVVAVLDIDSKELATFNSEDKLAFEKISKIISQLF